MAFLQFDLAEPKLKERLHAHQSTPGYCIIVDMVECTKLKDQPFPDWAARIYDTFQLIRMHIPLTPLKIMGDALMFYVPQWQIGNGKPITDSLSLFLSMCYVVQEPDNTFGATRIAAAYCQNAYELSFTKDTHDIYGKDVDLTARLLSLAMEREILMNEPFVEQIRAHYGRSSKQADYPDVLNITGPWPQPLKGFKDCVNIYRLPAGGISLSSQKYPPGFR